MGAMADFYVGRGAGATWIGSIAWDGYPDGIDNSILSAKNEGEYRRAVRDFLAGRIDAMRPADGWPWGSSGDADYVYAFDGTVWCFHSGADCLRNEWGRSSIDGRFANG